MIPREPPRECPGAVKSLAKGGGTNVHYNIKMWALCECDHLKGPYMSLEIRQLFPPSTYTARLRYGLFGKMLGRGEWKSFVFAFGFCSLVMFWWPAPWGRARLHLQHHCPSVSRFPCCGPRNTWPAAALLPSLVPDTHSAPSDFNSTLQPHYCEIMCFPIRAGTGSVFDHHCIPSIAPGTKKRFWMNYWRN